MGLDEVILACQWLLQGKPVPPLFKRELLAEVVEFWKKKDDVEVVADDVTSLLPFVYPEMRLRS